MNQKMELLLKEQIGEANKLMEQLSVTIDSLLKVNLGKIQCPVCTKIQSKQIEDIRLTVFSDPDVEAPKCEICEDSFYRDGDIEHKCEFCEETFLVAYEYVPQVKTIPIVQNKA